MLQRMRWSDASISSLLLFFVAFSVASLKSSLSVNLRNDTTVADRWNFNDIDNSSKNDRHRSSSGDAQKPPAGVMTSSTVLTHLSTPKSYSSSSSFDTQQSSIPNHSYPLAFDTVPPSHHDTVDDLFTSAMFSHQQPSVAPQMQNEGDDYGSPSPFPDGPESSVVYTSKPLEGNQSQQHSLKFLDIMFIGYDKRAWPTYSEKTPTEVEVNIYINSLGSVNAANMEYSMDIYLRQKWVDPRLALSRFNITESVTLNGEDIVQKIWKPDLFFRNVKQANFHTVTVPNKLIKLSPNGEILFSMRLTLRLSCHMSFRHYPLDTQSCDVVLGSYAQTVDQVVIEWQKVKPILIEFPLELPEFDVTSYSSSSFTRTIDTGSFSFLNATFTLVRQNGYHLIQTYMPTFLIVMISWVSFWLNVDATPARVTLGVTTLLTLTTVASGVRTQLPPVSYVKAIDVWIGACSVMVFGALLEFTLVNYLSRSKLRPEEIRKSINIFHWSKKVQLNHAMDDQMAPEGELARNLKRARTVDRVSRVMFPLLFFIFNAVYWPYYLYVPDRQ